jgi:uncharacterized YccA/Bax inhibitor family protein
MANNPALNKFRSTVMAPARPANPAGPGMGQAPPVGQLEQMYNQPAYGGPTYPPTGGVPGYGGGGSGGAPSRYMTLDAVVVRFSAMLAVLFTTGAVAWALTPRSNATPILLIGVMGGLALGLYISFTMKANAVTSLVYAGFEGLFLGAISRLFNAQYAGIVVQALTGTVMVAGGVLIAYKVGAIRVTPKFWRVTIAATIGVFGLMVVNMIAYLFHPGGLGLRDGGTLAIVFSLLCIGIAAMNLVLDFDVIEQGIKHGADEKLAWYAAFGLMVTLVWLYLEILRLLGYLRN